LDRNLLIARVELARLLIGSKGASTAFEVMNETPSAQRKTIPAIIARNWALLALNDNAEARQEINAGLAMAKAPELLLQDAVLKLAEKDLAGARVSIDEALSRQPEYIQAWELLGQTYAGQKQPQKAVERLQQVALQRPQSAPLQLLLGRWMMNVGKPAEARTAFEAAKKIDPKSTAADMALARLDITQGSMDAARQHLAAVMAAQPQNAAPRLLLGEIAERTGDRTGAIAQYRAVVAIDHSSLMALNNLAYMLSKDNPDEALKYAQQAGEIAPDSPAVEDTLGWAYFRKGDYEGAIRYLKTAVEKDGTPRRKYHLGMAYLKAGNQDLGQKLLTSAVAADPTLATNQGW
jgi:Tfp pilus assembly protein PilF